MTALCALAVIGGFTSCSDDDDYDDSWKEGSKVELPQYRAFILCEGTMGKNNSHLFFVDPTTDKPMAGDIYELQNGKKLGDTANDMIVEDGYIYIVMNVSKRLVKLNGSGVELASYSFDDELGEPRKVVEEDGKLYVTTYGGYVARFDAQTLAYEARVKVDANPEEIIEHDGYLYCVNSGLGSGNTISAINISTFTSPESYKTLDNPYSIFEEDDRIYVVAHGFYDPITWEHTEAVGIFNPHTHVTTLLEGQHPTNVIAVDNTLYMTTSTSPDWVSYTTTFSKCNVLTGETSEWTLTNAPAELTSGNVYMLERNPYDGSFYIATSDYATDSPVYHFDRNGKYIGKFSAGGICPNSMLFIR